MKSLFSNPSTFIQGPLESILYIGVGSSIDLSDLKCLNPKRIALVEGDPEAAKQLALSLANETSCQVLPALVKSDGTVTRFFRYSLPFLNGILGIGKLNTLYPRLNVIKELDVPSTNLWTLLGTLSLPKTGKGLLILDIPGQEAAILESAYPEQLQAFEWIIVRGCKSALQEGAQTLEASIAHLEEAVFKLVVTDADSDPAWPVCLFQYDHRMANLQGELAHQTRLLLGRATKIEEQAQSISALEATLAANQKELDGARVQQKQLTKKNIDLGAALALSDSKVTPQATEIAALQAELAKQTSLAEEQAPRIAALQAELAKQTSLAEAQASKLAILQTELAKQTSLAEAQAPAIATLQTELAKQTTRAEAQAAQIADLQAELAKKTTLIEVLGKGRTQQDNVYKEVSQERISLRAEVEKLKAHNQQLEELLAGQQARTKLIDNEFQKVEGQIDLIKEIFLREKK